MENIEIKYTALEAQKEIDLYGLFNEVINPDVQEVIDDRQKIFH